MTSSTEARTQIPSVVLWTAATAAVWIGAAMLRTDTTLHLGPLLVPIVAAILARETDHPYLFTLGGVAVGGLVIAFLEVSGNLTGPPIEPFTTVLSESFILLGVGGLIGLAINAVSAVSSRNVS